MAHMVDIMYVDYEEKMEKEEQENERAEDIGPYPYSSEYTSSSSSSHHSN